MMSMRKIGKGSIPAELLKEPLYLYGAGKMARTCLPVLEAAGVRVKAAIDDNRANWGGTIGRQNGGGGNYHLLRGLCKGGKGDRTRQCDDCVY